MDLHQLWTILSTPDNVPIVLLLFVVPFYTWYGLRQAFANDRLIAQLEADPGDGQDAPPQDAAVAPGVGARSPRLAVPAAHRVSGGDHRHDHSDGLVDHAERAAGRAGQPHADDESVEGAVVLPGPAGNAGLLRPVDGRRGDALADHRGADGDSVHRHQSAGQRLLHLTSSASSRS